MSSSSHRDTKSLTAVLIDYVTDADSRCHFEEIGCDATIEACRSFGGQNGSKH